MSTAGQWLGFATLALQLSETTLPRFAHKFSPQCFTLPQLATCVLLKEYRQLDWRGIEALLELSPALRHTLGLKRPPDFSTLWRFAQRWLDAPRLGRLLAALVRRLALPPVSVAVDSTGLDPGRTSTYFVARHRQRYVKLSLSIVVGRLVAVSAVVDWGPCNDKTELPNCWPKRSHASWSVSCMPRPATTPKGCTSGVVTGWAFAVGFRPPCIGPTAPRAATGAQAWRKACRRATVAAGPRKVTCAR